MIKNNNPLRIAIAGLGFGESVHIPASLTNKNIELVGLWHPRKERLNQACNKYNLYPHPVITIHFNIIILKIGIHTLLDRLIKA